MSMVPSSSPLEKLCQCQLHTVYQELIVLFFQVIVVSVNYRLGALGFLNDGDLTTEALDGNYGMRDMVLAFEWVNKYISEFGGDPTEVTLFGESAGAAGTAVLALSPMMDGLIKRHIQERFVIAIFTNLT